MRSIDCEPTNCSSSRFSAMAEPPEEREGKLSARCEGFSLQAGRHLHEKDREGLEALLRYCLRPPVSQERLSMAEDGSDKGVLKLQRPLADGRATLEMTPITLLKRLAGLVPRPRSHAIHYYGGVARPPKPGQPDGSGQPQGRQGRPGG